MSSRHRQNRPFDENQPEPGTAEWTNPAPDADAQTMHGLHIASQNVLRLATQTYNAAARGDEAAAHAARASLEQQLGLTTRLIDELVSGGADQPTMH
ncbi:hypothetical protein LMG28727_03312 [Paraburkholderia kirstenboschensis]|jgi:hypothetical protein|uniref:hypothetical protein n=1 Tax=Paraburkholderia kirstenboschensis TaxID=1245436 RepID=UPI000A766C12|nr:hypothetical protein [Paraburkholderia kirstenboschensis]CAD6536180.1 hypothetical protein LMG28727_03312 [Paraburkholderia kirstenboschensis]